MTTTIVKDSTSLVSALKVAHAGDVIQLASGSYSPIALTGLKFDGAVTVMSQNPNALAMLNGLTVKDCQGLTFKNLDMAVDAAKADYPYMVIGSNKIAFDGLNVHGSLDGNAQNDAAAMLIRNSKDVSVTNSEFQQLRHGIGHMDSDGVTISNNSFHDLQTDGVRGGGSSHVTVSNNYFTNFHMADGDHPDAIQFWTTNTTKSASDITVSGNVVVRGGGDSIQGVFFRDQVGTLPFQSVTITNNIVVGGMYNGISVNGAKDLVISGNTVSGLGDQRSWILTTNADRVTLTGNTATDYLLEGSTNLTETNDRTIATPSDGGKALLSAWALSHVLPSGAINKATTLSAEDVKRMGAGDAAKATLTSAANAAMQNMEVSRATLTKVNGTAGADSLRVDAAHDTYVDAGAGNDVIYGGGIGHNTMAGGAGDDAYYVKNDFERVLENAGSGTDTVIASVDFSLSANVENLKLAGKAYFGAGNELDNKITGSDEANEIRGLAGDDQIQSAGGDDRVFGGEGADTLQGGLGGDTLSGDNGADKLVGDEGSDSLNGGAGADTLEGGAGADTLAGGAGADMFVFRDGDLSKTPDRILDFSRNDGDKISLQAIDANTTLAGDQKFAFIGTAAFHKIAGELHMEVAGGVTTLTGDTNGDGLADFSLVVPGAGTLVAADFLL